MSPDIKNPVLLVGYLDEEWFKHEPLTEEQRQAIRTEAHERILRKWNWVHTGNIGHVDVGHHHEFVAASDRDLTIAGAFMERLAEAYDGQRSPDTEKLIVAVDETILERAKANGMTDLPRVTVKETLKLKSCKPCVPARPSCWINESVLELSDKYGNALYEQIGYQEATYRINLLLFVMWCCE